jgi:hypothetical protein
MMRLVVNDSIVMLRHDTDEGWGDMIEFLFANNFPSEWQIEKH